MVEAKAIYLNATEVSGDVGPLEALINIEDLRLPRHLVRRHVGRDREFDRRINRKLRQPTDIETEMYIMAMDGDEAQNDPLEEYSPLPVLRIHIPEYQQLLPAPSACFQLQHHTAIFLNLGRDMGAHPKGGSISAEPQGPAHEKSMAFRVGRQSMKRCRLT